ncbi:hypothetical protein, conserved [Plasmodium gonderi]|uniref:RNA polymerase sigma-70 region 3 domain-containing protein n=1 Tax=Plasmodium gonderi TaxID=77519 RepID=A0A1Y1JH12_PLAGO|nr:hypothetical protein, conserved [Plasmodium gonderi]GAW81819.1 hypothetical protein, conserved [Plasmodium gonderi]
MQLLSLLIVAINIFNFKTRSIARKGRILQYYCVYVHYLILLCKNAKNVEGYQVTSVRFPCGTGELNNLRDFRRKKHKRVFFKYDNYRNVKWGETTSCRRNRCRSRFYATNVKSNQPWEESINPEKEVNDGSTTKKKVYNYFNALSKSSVINKMVDENVNFEDGVVSFFTLNANPNIGFLINNMKKGKKREQHLINAEKENINGKSFDQKKKMKLMDEKRRHNERNKNETSLIMEEKKKKKIRLKLKRGYMNEIYDREKRKLNDILLSFKDKNIFNIKKKKRLKENILLLNGKTVNIEVIKQYLFHKLRLEYYESIRDQKKILTLDLWSKEINVSVENLKKLIVYIYKMKTLVQKEDEELLIKTYFYNKKNMFLLFRNSTSPGQKVDMLDFPLPDVISQSDSPDDPARVNMQTGCQMNNNGLTSKGEEFKGAIEESPLDKSVKGGGKDTECYVRNGRRREKKVGNVGETAHVGEDAGVSGRTEFLADTKTYLKNNVVKNTGMNASYEHDIFADYFEGKESVEYKDCENLINAEVQKFMECIKDVVFFENSIYMLEKLQNRPPLLEEIIFAYNYEKEIFIKKLEQKIKLSQQLLIYFIPLINNIIKKAESNFTSNLTEDDFLLVSLDAVKNGFKKYDVEKLGIKNLTKYVYMWAKNSTYNYYQKHKTFVSVSPHTYNDYSKIKTFEENFAEKNERKPSIEEISHGLNMSIERVQKALSSAVNIIDAEKPITYQNSNSAHPEKNTYKDLIVNSDDIHSINEIMYNDIVIKGLRKFICNSLKKKINKLIIFMKFGLFLKKKIYTDEEICQTLQITKNKFQKHFQISLNQIKNYINKIKKMKTMKKMNTLKNKMSENDLNFDITSYMNFSEYDFLGNEFSQIML